MAKCRFKIERVYPTWITVGVEKLCDSGYAVRSWKLSGYVCSPVSSLAGVGEKLTTLRAAVACLVQKFMLPTFGIVAIIKEEAVTVCS